MIPYLLLVIGILMYFSSKLKFIWTKREDFVSQKTLNEIRYNMGKDMK